MRTYSLEIKQFYGKLSLAAHRVITSCLALPIRSLTMVIRPDHTTQNITVESLIYIKVINAFREPKPNPEYTATTNPLVL
jgi:hypothetical protein